MTPEETELYKAAKMIGDAIKSNQISEIAANWLNDGFPLVGLNVIMHDEKEAAKPKLNPKLLELLTKARDSISNEANYFNMSRYYLSPELAERLNNTSPYEKMPTCGTPSCLVGWMTHHTGSLDNIFTNGYNEIQAYTDNSLNDNELFYMSQGDWCEGKAYFEITREETLRYLDKAIAEQNIKVKI